MKNLLIGSRALSYWCPDCKTKPDTDWDVISDTPIEGTEWHNPELLNNRKLEVFASNYTVEFNGSVLHVVTPAGLALIKRSHLWRDLSFDKHITMYHKYLGEYVFQSSLFCSSYVDIYEERTRLTHLEFPQGHPKLNQHVDTFFADAVTKKYSHDWLHELYAYEDQPMYTRLQKDKTSAWCSKELWYNLHRQQKKVSGSYFRILRLLID